MRIEQAMTREFATIPADTTIEQAAESMRDRDVGMLPVIAMNGRMVGVITDRDIALRCVADRRPAATVVGELFSDDVQACFADEDASEVAARMAQRKVRRLPVLSRDERLVGVIGLADLVDAVEPEVLQATFAALTEPGAGARHA